MTWTETHRRTDALREIEAAAALDASGELPWRPEYAALFGDRERLIALLRSRWETRRAAQLDSHLPEPLLAELEAGLAERSVGLVRILRRHDRDVADKAAEATRAETRAETLEEASRSLEHAC